MRAVDIQRRYFDAFNSGIGKELNVTIIYRKETYHQVTIMINGQQSFVYLEKLKEEGLTGR
jgi:hypothetical protein